MKEILNKFSKQDPNQTDVSVLDRVNSHSLCQWSEKVRKKLNFFLVNRKIIFKNILDIDFLAKYK